VPHPDLAEQETIVDRLGRVREAGDIQEKVAAAADELKAALLASAFTRGLRGEAHRETELGPVPERWVEVRLADVGDVVTGTTPPTKEPKYYEGGDFPFITPGDIGHARAIESTQRHLTRAGLDAARSLPSGATCVVCIGATIGKVGLTTVVDSATNQQINAVIPSASYDPKFVFYALSFYADVFRRAATPGPIPLLSKGSFEQLSIHVTPDMGEQREIVAVLQVIDEKVSLHRARNVLLKELFFGLLRQFMANEADPDEVHDSAPSDGVTYLEEVLAT
jgi:type I restriction enzyme S subunit